VLNPIERLMSTLADARWHGWLSVEWERKWHPRLPVIETALSAVRAWTGQ
jgi:uncharacterized protein YhjY with autotransporter beta-barrel domain